MNLWLWIAVVVAVLAVAGVTATAMVVGWKLTHPPRKPVEMNPEEFGLCHYQSVTFPSRDPDILLSGWYMEAGHHGFPSKRVTIIFAHGYRQNRLEPHLPALSLAARLVKAGYHVLMFDFRNSGLSQGRATTVGLREQLDLIGAIDFVKETHPDDRIVLHGFSMGAATSLVVAGDDDRVAAVVADSPFYWLWEYLQENLPQWTGLPRYPFNAVILTVIPLLLRADPRKVRPFEGIRKCSPRPVLLIHGMSDGTVPYQDSRRLQEAANRSNVELWLVEGADHVRSYARNPVAYTSRVLAFLHKQVDVQT